MPLFLMWATSLGTAFSSFFTQTVEFFVKKLGWQLAALLVALTTFATIFILFVGATSLIVPTLPNFLLVPISWIIPSSAHEIIGSVIALRVTTMVVCWKLVFLRFVANVITH